MTVLKSSNSVVCRSVEPLFPGWILWIHDISVGLFLPPIRCHQVLRMCAFLFQLKFSELTVLCEEPPEEPLELAAWSHWGWDPQRGKMQEDNEWHVQTIEKHGTWMTMIMSYYGILWHIMAYCHSFAWSFFGVFLKSLQVTTSQGSGSWPCRCWGWIRSRLSGAYPWRIHGAAIYMCIYIYICHIW